MSITGNVCTRLSGNNFGAWGVANGAGAAGATVSVNVTAPDNILPPSGQYFVSVELAADYTYFITAKSGTGFTVNIQPRLAANLVAAGAFNAVAAW